MSRGRPAVLASLTEPENRPGQRQSRSSSWHTHARHAHLAHHGAVSRPRWAAGALGAWLLFVVAATVLGGAVGRAGLPNYRQGAGDSARAEQILARAHISQPATELVLVHSTTAAVTTASPGF